MMKECQRDLEQCAVVPATMNGGRIKQKREKTVHLYETITVNVNMSFHPSLHHLIPGLQEFPEYW